MNYTTIVYNSIQKSRYERRTIKGIARDTGLDTKIIKRVLYLNPRHFRKIGGCREEMFQIKG